MNARSAVLARRGGAPFVTGRERSPSASAARVTEFATPPSAVWWTLRVGAFLCFVGHGAFGVITKAAWLPFFAVAGIGPEAAYHLMPLIGAVDIVLGVLVLVSPRAAIFAYMAVWALWTAALRPLSGQPVWEMLERAGNYGVPVALLVLVGRTRTWRSWAALATMRRLAPSHRRVLQRVLVITTSLLLLGHGALALAHKPELVAHYAVIAPMYGPAMSTAIGWLEIATALLLVWRQPVALCVAICVWKVATESLFLAAGAPVWEVVERGGSYAAPLALAFLVWHAPRVASAGATRREA